MCKFGAKNPVHPASNVVGIFPSQASLKKLRVPVGDVMKRTIDKLPLVKVLLPGNAKSFNDAMSCFKVNFMLPWCQLEKLL